MKTTNYTQVRPPGACFDNAAVGLILHWMHPLRLKAFRGFAAAAAMLIMATGCESDGETVPMRTAGPLPPAAAEPRPILVAQADATPAKIDKPAAAAEVSTNVTPPLTTAEATAKAMAAVGATNAPTVTTTNATPQITEEIPPARPANLTISESTEKVLKLTESNLDEKVILTFVQQTPAKFDLDADEIVYLSDVGVPSTVIAAMLKHDGDDPSKAEHITNVANTENVQPAIPANPNLPPSIAQTQAPPPPVQGQTIEVTTNYVPNPNQPVVVQQAPPPQTIVVEQQPTVVYAQPETVSYFYDSLSPYGSWMYVSDYGWCWQPTVAVIDQGWRPYGPRGSWVWTDAGWYWRSDYTWGWAPFHYGRWHMAGGRGWLWVPDRTWGPAWVTWRSSGDYCGWAPLPPHAVFQPGIGFTYFGRGVDVSFGFGLGYDAFCFAPVSRFHTRHVYDYCLPRHETVRVFTHSHVANRWDFSHDRHDWVNRAGPRLEQGLRPATVRTMSDNDRSRWGNRERVERSGRDTVIYRPPTPAPASASSSIADRGGAPRGREAWSTRAGTEVSTRPSTTSGIATPAGQPRTFDPSRRGDRDGRESVGEAIAPSRQTAGTAAPSTTTPSPTTGGPRPISSMPSPATSTPGIGSSAGASSRAPRPAGDPRFDTQSTRRPLADASPAVTPTPRFDNPPRTTTTAEPVNGRRQFSRPEIEQPSTPAPRVSVPAQTTVAPQITAPPPRTVAPAPEIVSPSPRIVAPPPSTPAPVRTTPSFSPRITPLPPQTYSSPAPSRPSPAAPSYSTPTYTAPQRGNVSAAPTPRAPVAQTPSAPRGEPRQAGPPSSVSPGRGRGRDN